MINEDTFFNIIVTLYFITGALFTIMLFILIAFFMKIDINNRKKRLDELRKLINEAVKKK